MVAVDIRRISSPSDTDIVMSDCIATVTPMLAAAPQAASEFAQTRPEKWMERFVLVPEECPVVSMTSAVARTFGPAVSEEYSPGVLAGGGGGGCCGIPLVVVESDTARVSVLPMVESDTARLSVLPVAGCELPAVFLGKVALDVVGLGVGPPCL